MPLRHGWKPLLGALLLLLAAGGTASAVTSAGGLTWSAPKLIDGAQPFASPPQDNDVSCASANLCAIVDSNGDILTSTNPFGATGGWRVTHIAIASAPASGACGLGGPPDICLAGISCPSATLCVAVGSYDPPALGAGASGPVTGAIESSTTPTAGPQAWALTDADPGTVIDDIACPSVALCVAVDSDGAVLVSTTPAKASSWTEARVDGGRSLQAISCPSVKLCVAVDNFGGVLASTSPAGGRKLWHRTATPLTSLSSVSCPSAKLCLAADQGSGKLIVATKPGSVTAVWRAAQPSSGASSVYCESASLCLSTTSSTNGSPGIQTSSSAANPSSWKANASGQAFTRMACASSSDCIAVNGSASAPRTTTDASGASAAWQALTIAGDGDNGLAAIACPSTSLCVTGDDNGRVLTFDPATGRPRKVTTATLDLGANVGAIACPTAQQCVAAADDIGGIGFDGASTTFVSSNPGGGAAGAWTKRSLPVASADFQQLDGASCPSATKCLLSDGSGQVWESLDPLKGMWTALSFDGPPQFSGGETGDPLNAIACQGASGICVAVGGQSGTGNGSAYSSDGKGWLPFTVDAHAPLDTVACPSVALCVGGDAAGNIVSTGTPLGGSWTATSVDGTNAITSIACPSATFCVAVDAAGNLLTSHTPSGPASAWTVTPADRSGSLTAIACPSSALCVVVDGSGQVVIGKP